MTMLIAGHETTAAVLTWAVFLLAQVCLPCAEVRYICIYINIRDKLELFVWLPFVRPSSFYYTMPMHIALLIAECNQNEEGSGRGRFGAG